MRKYISKNRILSILSRIVIIGLWTFISKIIDNEVIFPTIKSIIISLIGIVKDPKFISIIGYSLIRGLIGFFISLIFPSFALYKKIFLSH